METPQYKTFTYLVEDDTLCTEHVQNWIDLVVGQGMVIMQLSTSYANEGDRCYRTVTGLAVKKEEVAQQPSNIVTPVPIRRPQ